MKKLIHEVYVLLGVVILLLGIVAFFTFFSYNKEYKPVIDTCWEGNEDSHAYSICFEENKLCYFSAYDKDYPEIDAIKCFYEMHSGHQVFIYANEEGGRAYFYGRMIDSVSMELKNQFTNNIVLLKRTRWVDPEAQK